MNDDGPPARVSRAALAQAFHTEENPMSTPAENARAAAGRYTTEPCGRTARTTKYGSPYVLICQLRLDHRTRCKDVDNGLWFEPDGNAP